MKTPASEGNFAAKAGWLIILLVSGWLVFLLLPRPENEPAAKPPEVPSPPSSLVRAGLRDYTDWEGLPEIFAVWADKAEWKDSKTRFAYWHPVMKTYSYYFEAVRVNGSYRFKEIAEPHEPDYLWESMGDDCPISFYRSLPPIHSPARHLLNPASNDQTKLTLDIAMPKVSAPLINPESKP